jgi:carboxyl-terminal processing protease
MKRERLAWIVSLCLMSVLAFKLPGSMAERDDDYSFVRTLVDIHRQVSANYVEPVDEEALRQKAIEGMLSDLDPFSVYIPPVERESFDNLLDNSFRGVGIEFDMQDGRATVVTPIEGSPAFNAGVQAGDVILKVDGKSVEGLQTGDMSKRIKGPLGSKVTLTVQHQDGQIADLPMTRQEIVLTTVKGWQHQPDASWDYYVNQDPKIAYLRITQFTENTFDELHEALVGKPGTPGLIDTGMKGMVLDLRFNPGGRLDQAIKVVNMFVKEGSVIVSTKGRNRPESIVHATAENKLPYFPMIVMVNQHSASAAEIVSGSLKDNQRAMIIGERSYGKGSVQELIPLDDNGGELKLTVAYYYLPSGRLVHRKKDATDWGVEPQLVVPMDEESQRLVIEKYSRQEAIHPATYKAATQPTTEPEDAQLHAAIAALIADSVIRHSEASLQGLPATQPIGG